MICTTYNVDIIKYCNKFIVLLIRHGADLPFAILKEIYI